MSKEMAATFIEKARTDGAFQQKLMDLGPDASVADVLDVAAVLGYQFTEKDLFDAAKDDAEARHANGEELSEIELDSVAGGRRFTVTIVTLVSITEPVSIIKI